jgi:hypothetical protein
MNDIITGASPPVTGAMIAANETYHRAAQLRDDFDDAVDLLSDLVRVDSSGKLICLREANTESMRWKIGDQAKYSLLKELPAYADVQTALQAIRHDLDTAPSVESRIDLVGTMLDVQGISPDLKYIQYLAWKLGDCPQLKTEIHKRSKPWFSLATISRTVDEVLMTLRPEDGRPIPIADVLDVAGRHASELISLHRSTIRLNNTIVRFQRIVDATKDAKKPPDRPEPAVATGDDPDSPF